DLLAVDEPAAFDLGPTRLDAGGVRAGLRLAEQLTPDDFLPQRRRHHSLRLLLSRVLDDREEVPRRDAVVRTLDAGSCELLLDDELLDRTGIATPWLGPVRHHVAGLD